LYNREHYYCRHERHLRKPVLETYNIYVKLSKTVLQELLRHIFPTMLFNSQPSWYYSIGQNTERKLTFSTSNIFSPFESIK